MGEGFKYIGDLVKPWKGCYKLFTQGEGTCKHSYHTFDFDESKKQWICCKKDGFYSEGCKKDENHHSFYWPDYRGKF